VLFNRQQASNAEKEEQIKMREGIYQFLNQREQNELSFQADSYKTLFDKVLKSNMQLGLKVSSLRLFYHNAKEHFNPRAFFDVFEAESMKNPNGQNIREDLYSFGREIATDEESLIESEAQQTFPSFWLAPGKSFIDTLISAENTQDDNDTHYVKITVKEIKRNTVVVQTEILEDIQKDVQRFEVSYFDVPYSDFTRFHDHHRFAVTLKKVDTTVDHWRAQIKIVEFPAHFLLSGERPSMAEVNEMAREMGLNDIDQERQHQQSIWNKLGFSSSAIY